MEIQLWSIALSATFLQRIDSTHSIVLFLNKERKPFLMYELEFQMNLNIWTAEIKQETWILR